MNKVNTNNFNLMHDDHGISDEQLEYIYATLGDMPDGFFIQQVDLPDHLGTVENALWGPVCGDAPVDEGDVFYACRGLDRGWKDRMVRRPSRPVTFCQVIGIRNGGDFTIFTVYGGPVAPQNPDDPNNADPEGAKAFFAKHAFAAG